ncbi:MULTISPECIES: helix-turn-helix domain-containing protein [Myxococcaceae]|uniref:helix-turn-helix domain-containing protein n=1 Tax=Myxococcaceae TaxID=31 RepID=UPI00188E33BF|nr:MULTISPECIES: helix-turn-helix transcriptional regulator [Myxococcaceae]MBF5046397.1 helix-turn-helix transcriptional regulator [Simulacricoccus sp. 17bor-14]
MPDKLTPLAEVILSRRQQLGWSQEQLALVAGVSVRTVQRIEAGGLAAVETVRSLAAALDLDPGHLLALRQPRAAVDPAPDVPRMLPPLSLGSQVTALIDGARAHRFTFEDPTNAEVSQLLSDFGQNLKEHIEVWDVLEPQHRVEAVELFGGFLRQLRKWGWSAFGSATDELYGGPQGALLKVVNVRVLPLTSPELSWDVEALAKLRELLAGVGEAPRAKAFVN